MMENKEKKAKEEQVWLGVMAVIPVMVLMNLGQELTDDFGLRILYAGLFGGLGGGLGFGAYALVKNKGFIPKLLMAIAITAASGIALFLGISALQQSDEALIKQEWFIQRIGTIEFETPVELQLDSDEVPEQVKFFYEELKIYSDGNNDRITSFIQAKTTTDTMAIERSFSGGLEGMLGKMNVDLDGVEIEFLVADEEEISAIFDFDLNGKKMKGFGFMFKKGKVLDALWLLPLKRSFSEEYIENFELGILPDYE